MNGIGITTLLLNAKNLDHPKECPARKALWQKAQFWLCCAMLFLLSPPNMAQDKLCILEGRVVNHKGMGLPYAHIISLTTRYATAADPAGRFLFRSAPGDSLLISSVGMRSAIIHIPLTATSGKHPILITLFTDTIELSEVVITPWPESWAEFKQAFVHLKLPSDDIDLSIPSEAITRAISEGRPHGVFLPGPVSILYDAFSKEAKSKRKYEKLSKRDLVITNIRRRLGDDLLVKLTSSESILDAILKIEDCPLDNLAIEALTEKEIIEVLLACLSKKP